MMQSLDSMNRDEIADVLVYAANCLQKHEKLQMELKKIKNMYRPTEGGYKELWHGIKPIGGKILTIVIALVLVGMFGEAFSALAQIFFCALGLNFGIAVLFANLSQFLIVILAPVIVQVVANKKIVRHNRKNADRLEQNKENNKLVYVEEQTVTEKIAQVSADYQKVGYLLPPDFKFDSQALLYMANLLRNGRAEKMGTAINIYEDDMHKKRMEAKQDELIRKQEEANRIAVASMIADGIAAGRQVAATERLAAAEEQKASALNRIARY